MVGASIASAQTYTVQKNDTLAKIATDNGVSMQSIVQMNHIVNANSITIGERLQLSPPKQNVATEIVNTANSLLGTTPYVFGGVTPYKGMDCSGYVQWVYKQHGINLPRTAQGMWDAYTWIPANELRIGDLVFLTGTDPSAGVLATHVGIYVGNGKFIEESSRYSHVVVADMWESYYKAHYLGAKRVLR